MTSPEWLSKKLILCLGKGGVGKSVIARHAASTLAASGKRTLLVHALQLTDHEQHIEPLARNLWAITLRPSDCFREYIMLKLKLKSLYSAFLSNKVTQYLEKAAPGVREMVLLGKIWFERLNYDHVVVEMPSTGYALAMLNTPINFSALFPGGPIYRDAKEMIETFSDPGATAFVTITLAEEMPLQESNELATHLKKMFPLNPTWLVVNRLVELDAKAQTLYASEKNNNRSFEWKALEFLAHKQKQQRGLLNSFYRTWPAHAPALELKEGEIAL